MKILAPVNLQNMYSQPIGLADNFVSAGISKPKATVYLHRSVPIRNPSIRLNFTRSFGKRSHCFHRTFAIVRNSNSSSSSQTGDSKENPSQAATDSKSDGVREGAAKSDSKNSLREYRWKLYDLVQNLSEEEFGKYMETLPRITLQKSMDEGAAKSDSKNSLREYRRKLYDPEQNLSEEEEFDKNMETLPRMRFEDFQKSMKSGKIMVLTLKEDGDWSYNNGFMDFVVELKPIPGAKFVQRTKWAMKLEENQARQILEEYTGPRREIKTLTTLLLEYVISHVTAFFLKMTNGKSDMLRFKVCYKLVCVKFQLPLSSTLADIKSQVCYKWEAEKEAYNLYYNDVWGDVLLFQECDWEELKKTLGTNQEFMLFLKPGLKTLWQVD